MDGDDWILALIIIVLVFAGMGFMVDIISKHIDKPKTIYICNSTEGQPLDITKLSNCLKIGD